MPSANEIRQHFLDYFARQGHTIVPSSPVVPVGDATLLFTNAGMNQFKDVFLGSGTRPFRRAADTQKCIRAGGKHNDLDDVGRDTYHHTFFEMLGNWSFGDYFKKEAIAWAWELLTHEWRMDPARLHVTVFTGDPQNGIPRDSEAAAIWESVGVPASRIHLGSKKDNFWEMGATGPCGPCTEIHYDRTPDLSGAKLVNGGDPRVIEIWNLVFIQFNRRDDGSLEPLPAQHVDTGMGFERLCAVLAGRDSNYDTDVFRPLMSAVADLAGKKYLGSLSDSGDIAFRVIADHVRAATFAITDGARPGNTGRDSVVKSIIRRAFRWGYAELGFQEPFLHKLVPVLADHMGGAGAFPELRPAAAATAAIIADEEASFLRTIDHTMRIYRRMAEKSKSAVGGAFSGDDLFELHTTHGLPADMAAQMARDEGLTPDMAGFAVRLKEHEDISRGQRSAGPEAVTLEGIAETPTTEFVGYDTDRVAEAHLVGLWNAKGKRIERGVSYDLAGNPDFTTVVALDKSPFYVEGGGQVGDTGILFNQYGRMEVQKVVRAVGRDGPVILHYGRVIDGVVQGGSIHAVGGPHNRYTAEVDARRRHTARNHTATHLLNLALRQEFGDGLDQRSSLQDENRTRFGFAFERALTEAEIASVEDRVNAAIAEDLPVTAVELPLAEAKQIKGVRAVFGEKYPDPVRVVMIGSDDPTLMTADMSTEFCGGTHVASTGRIGMFKIIAEEAESRGVRRITAVTGRGALDYNRRLESVVLALTEKLRVRPEELPARVDGLLSQLKELDKQLKKGAAADLTGLSDGLLESAPTVAGVKLIVGEIPKVADEPVRGAIDRIRTKAGGPCAVILGARDEAGAVIYAAATADAVAKGVHAGNLLKEIAVLVGGKGGGRPEGIAQGGGNLPDNLPDALARASEILRASLAK